jgi:serine/threonine protein kinase
MKFRFRLKSAPEVMRDIPGAQRYYNPKADIWSLGAILYFMVYGVPPNYHPLAANPPLGQSPYPDHDLNDMLRRTLVMDPRRRADIKEVAHHPFTQS